MNEIFADRADAGRRLATALKALELDDPVILALPRGVLWRRARLRAPMDHCWSADPARLWELACRHGRGRCYRWS